MDMAQAMFYIWIIAKFWWLIIPLMMIQFAIDVVLIILVLRR